MKQKRAVQDAGSSAGSRTALVSDLMTNRVMTATRHQTVGHVREVLQKHGVHSLPVVGADMELEGIVTSSDLLNGHSDQTRVGDVMTRDVLAVPMYAGVHIAARIMRNHKIHHLIVTHEKKVVGLVSSFDLLRLVEDKRFAAKNPPSTSKKKGGKRKRSEEAD